MAKAVGLDPGEFEVKVVELDGSLRKPRLAKVNIDRVEQVRSAAGDELHAEREAESALHALKDAAVGRENVTVSFPCREAVLRTLTVPFKGVDQIRKVIKFEAEGEIHSHNVDDMVVDFHVIEEVDDGTDVLVAAVPKRPLGVTLAALERHGIEPEVVDLDGMALFRVAEWLGCFAEGGADEGPGDDESTAVAVADGERIRVVIDVGARSLRVLAVRAGQLIDLRSLRLGVDSIADEVAQAAGVELVIARQAVVEILETGVDFVIDVDADEVDEPPPALAEGATEEVAVAVARVESVGVELVESVCERFLARVRRQLVQFLTSLKQVNGVDAVWITGGGCALPGLLGVLQEVFGCEVREIDVLSRLSHNLDDDEARWVGPRIAVAVGLALTSLGGRAGFNFRQEELAYTRRFDRIKFPLAIVCMLAVFLPFMYGIRMYNRLNYVERNLGQLYEVTEPEDGGRRGRSARQATFWGHVGYLVNDKARHPLQRYMDTRAYTTLVNALIDAPTKDRLKIVRTHLTNYLNSQKAETGIYEDLTLPSGYWVIASFADLIDRLTPQLGSFVIVDLDLSLDERRPFFEFKIAVRGSDFAERWQILEDAIREEAKRPESPWKGFEGAGRSDTFKGTAVEGAYFTLKVDLKENL